MRSVVIFGLGVIVGAVIYAGSLFAPSLISSHNNQPYKDEQGRAISSLSAKDVEQLRKGAGWGLAKPAEFNGYPGPLHVLEFADQLDLKGEQKVAIEASFAAMRAKAQELGEALITAEKALDEAFRNKAMDDAKLAALLRETENARARLRQVHLAAHLAVTPLLSEAQKTLYAELRGYGDGHSGHGGH